MEDSQIIALYNQRDERAIQETADKYGNYCLIIAHNILSDREDSEECVNDTWWKTWNTIPPKQPTRFRAFLASITRSLAIDRYRTKHRAKRGRDNVAIALDDLGETVSSGESADESLLAKELSGIINRFLQELSQRDREIFLARYYFVYPEKTIARRFGMRENYVSNLLSRTRRKLKKYLEKEGYSV